MVDRAVYGRFTRGLEGDSDLTGFDPFFPARRNNFNEGFYKYFGIFCQMRRNRWGSLFFFWGSGRSKAENARAHMAPARIWAVSQQLARGK